MELVFRPRQWAAIVVVCLASTAFGHDEGMNGKIIDMRARCIGAFANVVASADRVLEVVGGPSILDPVLQLSVLLQRRAVATRTFEGTTIQLQIGRDVIDVHVGELIGSGYFGMVHGVEVTAPPHLDLGKVLPSFVRDGQLRELVIKLTNPVNGGQREILRSYLREETREDEMIDAELVSLGFQPIATPDIVHYFAGEEPYIIKVRVRGVQDFAQILRAQGGDLTIEQWGKLRDQIFAPAYALWKSKRWALDIRTENLYWIPATRSWGSYERTLLPLNSPILVRRDWAGYDRFLSGVLRRLRR